VHSAKTEGCRQFGAVERLLGVTDPVAVDRAGEPEGVVDGREVAARLFAEHGDRLVGLACLLLRDQGEAEDVVQEAFLRLQRYAPSIETASREVAYLRSIVLNLARSRLRRQRLAVWKRPLALVAGAGPDEVVELRDEQRRVVTALRRLPARQRECLVLRHYEELSDGEIAETLGLSITSVRTHLRRGKASLERDMGTPSGGTS
jgi:RNA polymerase sigma factor (sigma-70 family)